MYAILFISQRAENIFEMRNLKRSKAFLCESQGEFVTQLLCVVFVSFPLVTYDSTHQVTDQ